jgi:hypothetical protein
VNVRPATARKVREVLEALADGRCEPWMMSAARDTVDAFRDRPGPKKAAIPSVAHVDARREAEHGAFLIGRQATRAAVAARANGCCEACGARRGEALHWDHFHGRAREESVESTWMLCPRCDREKTESKPSRLWWLRRFLAHCELHLYAEQIRKVTSLIGIELAQHGEHVG